MSQVKYDLLIKGGRLVDPAQGIDGTRDIGVRHGRVAAVEQELPEQSGLRVIDASGNLVTPGLIDLHTHVFEGLGISIAADPIGARSGVTTMVDTGSAGASNFQLFRDFVIPKATTRILPFLNIWLPGVEMAGAGGWKDEFTDEHAKLTSPQVGLKALGYFDDLSYASVDAAVKMVKESQGLIIGIKVWATPYTTGTLKPIKLAIEAAEATGLPVMLDNWVLPPLSESLALLRPGDIYTHTYGKNCGIVDRENKVIKAAFEARDRGVIFDVGHGSASFDFQKFQHALDQGFPPDTISTDLHKVCINGPVYDLPTTMTKFLAFGYTLKDVIYMTTTRPAQILHLEDRIGSLKVGNEADIAVFDLEKGEFDLLDAAVTADLSRANHITTHERLKCIQTIKAGRLL